MRSFLCAIVVVILLASPAFAWNDKGHMTVARLAWIKLTNDQRTAISEILTHHPDFSGFLKSGKPSGVSEDEWVFLKAATWPDFVRTPRDNPENHPSWHFIDQPIVAPGSHVTPPAPDPVNAVTKLSALVKQIKDQDDAHAAVSLCWILHLTGDIHQPLHCASRYSDNFRDGDRGGNRAFVAVNGNVIQLHKFWDGLLGKSNSYSSVLKTTTEIRDLMDQNPDVIADDLKNHLTPDAWAAEGFENAKKFAYADGSFEPANTDHDIGDDEIPDAPRGYETTAGQVAQICAAKGGTRLAGLLAAIYP